MCGRDWSSDVCSSDLGNDMVRVNEPQSVSYTSIGIQPVQANPLTENTAGTMRDYSLCSSLTLSHSSHNR